MEIAVGTRFIASATKRPQQTDAINGRNKTDATNGRNKRPQQTPATKHPQQNTRNKRGCVKSHVLAHPLFHATMCCGL